MGMGIFQAPMKNGPPQLANPKDLFSKICFNLFNLFLFACLGVFWEVFGGDWEAFVR